MTDPIEPRHAVPTMIGGVLWSGVLALDDVAPAYVGLAVIVPVLLGFGVLELHGRYGDRYGSTGRAGVGLTGLGLACLLVATLLYATGPPGLVAVFVVAVPGVTGVVALAFGSALLAAALYRLGLLGAPAALLLGLGVPLTPLVGAVLAAVVGPGTLLGPVVPAGVAPGFAGTPYGVGWLAVGYRLRATADEGGEAGLDGRRPAVGASPQVVAAAVVGGAFALLGAGRFLPLGPVSGLPWVGRSLALDASHLLAGIVGLAVALGRNGRAARAYDRAVGLLSLAVVALVLLGTFGRLPGLGPLATDVLALTLPDLLFHLPAGVVLTAVGFGVDGGTTGEASQSGVA